MLWEGSQVHRVADNYRTDVGGAKGEGEGSGDSEEDVVGSAGMLAEPIRLQSDYGI